jgi:hypothetical protein
MTRPCKWLSLLLIASPLFAADIAKQQVDCEKAKYDYLLFDSQQPKQPAMLLLHGAGGSPDPMIAAWKDFAAYNSALRGNTFGKPDNILTRRSLQWPMVLQRGLARRGWRI